MAWTNVTTVKVRVILLAPTAVALNPSSIAQNVLIPNHILLPLPHGLIDRSALETFTASIAYDW